MTDEPREYDREYTTRAGTTVRRRLGYSHDHGEVTRFVVQLEYLYEGEWTPVVRYDHDPASMHGHDVTDEGLHIDVYRDGEKYRQEYVAPPMPANRPVSDDELDQLPGRISQHFDRVRDLVEQETDDSDA